ncbi:disintegrin and metalloproteinase domain-containing protein 10-like isoform X2 [Mya arenaria]|nr:disintegrin and metalloproteinase domain-containing protein 10-like isoform X2 [Mya arenaria]XP_052810102.1 disintegrin and metalloproteinase domain-containing protein 10-like isoform X2 [Mya arenaria]
MEDTVHENHTRSISYETSVLVGQVTGLQDSLVTCAVQNGVLQGIISSKGEETLYILPTTWVLKSPSIFWSVIYTEHDFKRDSLLHQFIRNHHKSYISLQQTHEGRKHTFFHKMSMPRGRRSIPEKTRNKDKENSFTKRVCTIKFTTDPFVWKHVMDRNGQNKIRAVNEIHYMIRDHLKVLNDIFEEAMFTVNKGTAGEFTFSGFQFEVGEIMIWDERHCAEKINVCSKRLPQRELLYRFLNTQDDFFDLYYSDNENPDYSYTDSDNNYPAVGEMPSSTHKHHCLSVLFTARSITQGLTPVPIYGLGYSPNDESPDTGICSTKNVAFVNLYVSEKVPYQPNMRTKLVFSHEVAHAFGAPHDNNETACGEYSVLNEPDAGYYLMHEVAVTGDLENNFKVSNCSLNKIGTVLARESSTLCFIEQKTSICGNGIVEEGEQCDCGSRCHLDNCCNPKGIKHECSLKQHAQCSPSQGPCCSVDTCRYYNQSENMVCQSAASCIDTLYCNGDSATCPVPSESQISPDNTTCRTDNDRVGVCHSGNCNRSVCNLIEWHECDLTNSAATSTLTEKEELCFVGCRKTKTSPCISTHDGLALAQFPELNNLLKTIAGRDKWHETSIRLPVGTPCNRLTGYCDVYQRCRGVDHDTTLAKFKRFVELFVDFLSSKIGVITLAIAVLFTFALVKWLKVHTKSSNSELELKHPHISVRESVTNVSYSVVHMGDSVRTSVSHMRRSLRNSSRNSFGQRRTLSRQNSPVVQELEHLRPEDDNVFEA